jgi:hypothetical protein
MRGIDRMRGVGQRRRIRILPTTPFGRGHRDGLKGLPYRTLGDRSEQLDYDRGYGEGVEHRGRLAALACAERVTVRELFRRAPGFYEETQRAAG